jgi:hypothetical protein
MNLKIATLLAAVAVGAVACGGGSDIEVRPGATTTTTEAATTTSTRRTTTTTSSRTTTSGRTSTTRGSATTIATTSSVPTDPAEIAKAYFDGGSITLTDDEAGCVADKMGAPAIANMRDALAGEISTLSEDASKALLYATSACEPVDYVAQLGANLQRQADTTDEQSTCVVKALDSLLVSDAEVLAQAASDKDTVDWPQPQQDAFKNALLTCVPEDVAQKIIEL